MRRTVAIILLALALSMPSATSLPLPGLNGQTTNNIPVIGRVFPEPLQTNDYIGYNEALAGLRFLNQTYPDRMELLLVGKSIGWPHRVTQQRDPKDVFIVEITNEKSQLSNDQKIQLVFMLSIHGNEKGGREGGFRVIEDFAKGNVGLLAEKPDLLKLLDYFLLIFVFPNADGWVHDEPEYCCPGGTMYTRVNANGVDLNRQWPTSGFMQNDRSHQTLSEPEVASIALYLKDHYHNVHYASDIHGMLNPADGPDAPPAPGAPPSASYAPELQRWLQNPDKGHYILGLLPAGQHTQEEMIRVTRLGELLKERLQANPKLAPWTQVPSTGVWGGNYIRWGTVWETIGYQVSGGSHDYFVSDAGLNAPSFSFEMSYNHIVCDSMYPGCGAAMNYFHVESVRQFVAIFMEGALNDLKISIETHGHKTAYLLNPKIWTNAQDKPLDGWAAENLKDDPWDYAHVAYEATPMDYLEDVATYVRDGDKPAIFEPIRINEVNTERLANYDTFVVSGSSYDLIKENAAVRSAIKAWVEKGGNLVLTDSALQMLPDLELVSAGAVAAGTSYMGYTDIVDTSHRLAKNMQGFSRQTYEGVPLGFQLSNSAPNWYVKADEARSKGKPVGTVNIGGSNAGIGGTPQVNYGEFPLGTGTVTFLGALLPDPSQESYHPYGLASYATTYAGNTFFLNMLDFELVFEAPPRVLEELGQARPASESKEEGEDTRAAKDAAGGIPGFEAIVLVGVVASLVALRRRR